MRAPKSPMRSMLLLRAGLVIMVFLHYFPVSLTADEFSINDRIADGSPLSVMSFNIRYGTANDGENNWENRRELVFHVIRTHACDVVGLQEALRFQIDAIRNIIPEYSEIGVGRDDGKTKGEYTAVLYRSDRLKVDHSGTFWLSDTPHVVASKTWGNSLPRICTWGRFIHKESGKAFYVYNVHLDHQSQPAREQSAVLVAQRIAQRDFPEPVVLLGDFNADESNLVIRYLKGESVITQKRFVTLADTFRVLHPTATEVGTFNEFKGNRSGSKIDYIFTLPDVHVLEAKIIFDMPGGRCPSDHFPVMARIELAN